MDASGGSDVGEPDRSGGPGDTAGTFPVKLAGDGHYLVDADGKPFRIHGDSAWSLIANLTAKEIDTYLADRSARGFNTLLVNLLEHKFAVQAPKNRAGDYPFTAHDTGKYDFSTPNEAYFAFADAALAKCQDSGMLVLLAVMYTGFGGGEEGFWSELTNATNSRETSYAYGKFLGTRWKDQANIVWMLSGDFGPPAGSEGEARLLEIYRGIRDAGATQLATAHLARDTVSSDWGAFADEVSLNGVYPGGEVLEIVALSRSAYGRDKAVPVFLFEPGYEAEGWTPGDPASIRSYEWWGQLSAIGGVMYGHRDIWAFNTDDWNTGYPFGAQRWQKSLGAPGAVAMQQMAALLDTLPFWRLVPSETGGMKKLVTNTDAQSGNLDYVASAAAPDGSLLLAYIPNAHSGEVVVDMTAMAGATSAQFWDPTNGATHAAGDALDNTGTHAFSPPKANAASDHDWVLMLTASP